MISILPTREDFVFKGDLDTLEIYNKVAKILDMKKILFFFVVLLPLLAVSQDSAVYAYITKYKDLAISEMQRVNIPASITLAQAIIESDAGRSVLVRKSNNNFGIKANTDWKGEIVYHDDDAKNERFRKYECDSLSFVDHSDFLATRKRYQFLFELKKTDYKGWAYGLKKAGYATSKEYAQKLIRCIEKYRLYEYDNISDIVSY
jgi:flagellum-specific peptidoglycan hydrolase FlgJ